ncbi:MAG: DUF2804 domain-containing protein [Bacteroidetes bacterium]|nr:DUF2804 domain-containing protein [Bacteroidota bacterium]
MLPQAPDSLKSFANGPVPFGLYAGPVADMSTAPWSALRRSQRKAWIFTSAFSTRYCVGFAIADAGMVATAFVYFFDTQTGQYIEEKTTVPLGFGAAFDPDLRSTWQLKNFSIKADTDRITCSFAGKRIHISLSLTENGNGSTTIAPAGDRPFHHTYKNLLMPAAVEGTIDGASIKFEGTIGGLDFSKGYPPRHTFWNWASMNAVTDHGVEFGVNLVGDFNNSIENALWVNGKVQQLSQATFSYERPVDKNTWQITTLDGTLNMKFTPRGARGEDINALVMMSRFKQPFGTFAGTVRLDGVLHNFTGQGVVEEHFAKW